MKYRPAPCPALTRRLALQRALLAAVILSIPAVAHAQPTEQKLMASDGSSENLFGHSVAVAGDLAVVGASGDDVNGTNSGAAYVFRREGGVWVEEQKLTASDGSSGANFGYSVAISGGFALVGAYLDGPHGTASGSVYVFHRIGSEWVQEQKLTASDGGPGDYFGRSVAISGDVVLIGANGDGPSGVHSGSAYVFRREGGVWVHEQKLTASDGRAGDNFGSSVAIWGDAALVGAPLHDGSGFFQEDMGTAYVFRHLGGEWGQERKLLPNDPFAFRGDHFGSSVAIWDDVALVGSPMNNFDSGAAYLYRYGGTTWLQEQKLTASDASAGNNLGSSVWIRGNVALVGSPLSNYASGSAYVYRYVGGAWMEEHRLTASDGNTGDYFGRSVSFSGDVAFVGVPYNDENGHNSGAAYAYDLSSTVATEPEATPTTFVLHPPAPNPAADRAAVTFALAEPAEVRLALHDVLGREVVAVAAVQLAAGTHRLSVDVSKLPAGVYVWRLAAGAHAEAGRLTVVR